MKKLPLGIQSFERLITMDCLYVDKTNHIYNLITRGSAYFLARPRRFGKSLLVSTLKEIFLAKKELFQGLWIATSDYDWQPYPVIHLDLSKLGKGSVEKLIIGLSFTLEEYGKEWGIDITGAPDLETKLDMLIRNLAQKHGPVVILIDEYDYPLLKNLQDTEEAHKQQEFLRSFYAAIKGLDNYLHFLFVTGISKFSRTTIFSGFNNLNDISFQERAGALLGYTQEELETNFSVYIQQLATKNNVSYQDTLHLLKEWYNGYRFCEEEINVYNPFSVICCLENLKCINYWFESGTPSFLDSLIRSQHITWDTIASYNLPRADLGTFNISDIPLIPILYQTGYLTIVDYNSATDSFYLDYPNREVRESFNRYVVQTLTQKNSYMLSNLLQELKKALKTNNMATFCLHLRSLFARIPYYLYIDQERYYHSLLQMILTLTGYEVYSELPTNKGCIDLVLQTDQYVYLFELKCDQPPTKALEQIEERKYYERFQGKQLILVGLSFKRTDEVVEVACETLSP